MPEKEQQKPTNERLLTPFLAGAAVVSLVVGVYLSSESDSQPVHHPIKVMAMGAPYDYDHERQVRAVVAQESRERREAVVILYKTIFYNQLAKNMLEAAAAQKIEASSQSANSNQGNSDAEITMSGQDFLTCTKGHESVNVGGYVAVSPDGEYHGAYQFDQSTWNTTAQMADRPDLVGVPAEQATPADQDTLALKLHSVRGNAPWNGRC